MTDHLDDLLRGGADRYRAAAAAIAVDDTADLRRRVKAARRRQRTGAAASVLAVLLVMVVALRLPGEHNSIVDVGRHETEQPVPPTGTTIPLPPGPTDPSTVVTVPVETGEPPAEEDERPQPPDSRGQETTGPTSAPSRSGRSPDTGTGGAPADGPGGIPDPAVPGPGPTSGDPGGGEGGSTVPGGTQTGSDDRPAPTTTTTTRPPAVFAMRGDGIGLSAFGDPVDEVLANMAAAGFGAPSEDKIQEDGGRLMTYGDNFGLTFQEGRLESWSLFYATGNPNREFYEFKTAEHGIGLRSTVGEIRARTGVPLPPEGEYFLCFTDGGGQVCALILPAQPEMQDSDRVRIMGGGGETPTTQTTK